MSLPAQLEPQVTPADTQEAGCRKSPVLPQAEFVRDPATGRIIRAINARGKIREVEMTSLEEGQGRFISTLSSAKETSPTTSLSEPCKPAPPPTAAAKSRDLNLPFPIADMFVTSRAPNLEHLLLGDEDEDEDEGELEVAKAKSLTIPFVRSKHKLRDLERSLESTWLSTSPSAKASKKKSLRSLTLSFKKNSKEKGEKITVSEKGRKVLSALKSHLSLGDKKDVLHYIRQLNDDHDYEGTYDTLSLGSNEAFPLTGGFTSSSPSGGFLEAGDTQVCLIKNSKQARIFDFANSQSPIRRAIQRQWPKAPHPLPIWEQERIQTHCFRLLRSSFIIPDDDDSICFLFQSYLAVYETTFNELFPHTCEALGLNPPVWQQDVLQALEEEEEFLYVYGTTVNPFPKTIAFFEQVETALRGEIIDSATINNMDYIHNAERFIKVCTKAREFWEGLPPKETDVEGEVNILTGLRIDVQNLEERLQQSAKVIQQFRKTDFRSNANWDQAINVMAETAQVCLSTAQAGKRADFAAACKKLTQWRAEQTYPFRGIPHFLLELKRREERLREILNIDEKAFTIARERVLSAQVPKERSKELFYLFDGQFYPITVSHKPMALVMFDVGLEGSQSALGVDGTLFPSCKRDADRAVNLTVTRVTLGNTDIMKEVRTGVPFAYTVTNKSLQKKITRQRFKDILTVCGLTFYPDQMKAGFRPEGQLSLHTFKLSMFYISLLSPDNLRPTFSSIPGVDNERLWCHKLDKRIEELNSEEIELPLHSQDGSKGSVRVQPEIFMFVCPCNQLAYASSLQLAHTWENADNYNRRSFLHLFGTLDPASPLSDDCYVQNFLDENPDLDPILKKELMELCYLIRYVFANKLHQVMGDTPFTFTTCISELGRVMRLAIASGCKSAKDRTGNYERSNIEMALHLYLVRKGLETRLKKEFESEYETAVGCSVEQVLPPIDRRMGTEDFYNNAMLLLCSDQIEITLDNIGKPGFKTPDYMLGFIKSLYPSIDAYLTPTISAAKIAKTVKAKGSSLSVTAGLSPVPTLQGSSPHLTGASKFYRPQ
ncbi:inositol phosphate phosphatase SopB [Sansalvadorimonas verongulae]|uniref:inositol phosphate phosphatase SopB n=1 Tax=Sansalvadorimonas verongulae TaxID=2172824 RepID=UPI0012BC0A67|nr:inositol phosphate phosphatase SopB [Sansalvadorimonas verongulae]MTI13524.1 hypothetical protein [Sansalvadorimonas verongulae]